MSGRATRAIPFLFWGGAAVFVVVRLVLGLSRSHDPSFGDGLVDWKAADDPSAVPATGGRPVLYDFSATWCEPCKAMEREVFADPELADLINRSYVPVRILDREQSPALKALRNQLGVSALPTLVVQPPDDDSQRSRRLEGYPGKEKTIAFLRGIAPQEP